MWKKIVTSTLASLLCLSGCSKEAQSPSEKARTVRGKIGISASIAASSFVEAMRECQIAGIGDLHACATNKGELLPEITAQLLASMSEKQTQEYFDECHAEYSVNYCNQLLERATLMEWRRPPTAKSDPN